MEAEEFVVYSNGLVYCSVCSSLPVEAVAERVNAQNPTGVTPWVLSQEAFKDGTANPSPCNQYPNTHKHYLFVC